MSGRHCFDGLVGDSAVLNHNFDNGGINLIILCIISMGARTILPLELISSLFRCW